MTTTTTERIAPSAAKWLCLVATVAGLAYLPGLSGSFLFDDFPNIVTNPRIHANELTLDTLSVAARAYEPGYYGRPLATIGFAIDHYIGGGEPFIYKLHGLLIHIINACLVFALARGLIVSAGQVTNDSRSALAPAALLAAVWATHPLQVSSVLYVVQRMETLAACFMLLAMLAYCRGRRHQIDGRAPGWGWLAVSGLLTVIGMLAKESAIVTPLLALVVEATLFRFRAASASGQRILRALYVFGAAMAIALIALAFMRYGNADAYASREYSAWERLLTQPRVLMLYLQQTVLPAPSLMPFYYDNYPHSTGLFQPWTTAASAAILAAMSGLAIWLRRRMPLVTLGILWFFAAHALTSGIIPLELAYEHRNYLALFGILLAIYALGSQWGQRVADATILRAVPVAILAGLFTVSLIRSMTWGSPLMLAMEMVENNPGSSRASNDLATLYFSRAQGNIESREWTLASQEFERGAALPGSSTLPEHGLILMHASVGLPAAPEWWESLIYKLQARAIAPQDKMAVTGLILERQKGFELDDQALSRAYRILLAKSELPAHTYCNIGDHALSRLEDKDFAEQMFLTCVRKSGPDPAIVQSTSNILRSEGHEKIAASILLLMPDP